MRYDAHLISLLLQDGENLLTVLVDKLLPTLHGLDLCNNWPLYRGCWDDCNSKKSHVPTFPKLTTVISRLLKTAEGGLTRVPAA